MKRTCVAAIPGSSIYPYVSEQEILDLQDLFLTHGYHYLNVSSHGQGRALISLFLESLQSNFFSRIACLTMSPAALPDGIASLHDELALHGALAFDHHRLDEFLLNEFYYDFVWIECSRELTQSPWFYYLEKKLVDYNIGLHTPIVFVQHDT
jgi:hypothetical protein